LKLIAALLIVPVEGFTTELLPQPYKSKSIKNNPIDVPEDTIFTIVFIITPCLSW
jgi:hypothetical protein